jgi:hypothetical protein
MKNAHIWSALVAVAACSPTSPPAPAVDAGPGWSVVLDKLDGTLLSVWGSSPSDVWTVGGPRGNAGFKTLVLHLEAKGWRRLDPGGTDTYWWVTGTSAQDVWFVGENGRITHWDGAAFKEMSSGTKATLFGAWASSPKDAWVVGGTPEGGTNAPNDVLLHWDGAAWTPVAVPAPAGRAFFKVWGSSADDVYVVGEAGTVWHLSGGAWKSENPKAAHGTLLTVNGCGKGDVYAVGNRDVLHSDGTSWTTVPLTLFNDVNGVSCGSPGAVVLVGSGGSKQRLVAGAWQDDFGTLPFSDLHGAWADGTGTYWAVGGNFVAPSAPNVSRQGVLARYGSGSVPTQLLP